MRCDLGKLLPIKLLHGYKNSSKGDRERLSSHKEVVTNSNFSQEARILEYFEDSPFLIPQTNHNADNLVDDDGVGGLKCHERAL